VLKISLQNGSSQAIMNSVLLFAFDSNTYVMGHEPESQQSIVIPILLPGPKQLLETSIYNIDPQGRAGQILVMLYKNEGQKTNPTPLLSATIRMPSSEPLL
jgi:hypothetical protein